MIQFSGVWPDGKVAKPNLDTYTDGPARSILDSAADHLIAGDWPSTWGPNPGPGEGVVCTKAQDGPVKGPIEKQVG